MSYIARKYAEAWKEYELIDAGGSKKLERFGEIITIRPELQAYFKSELPFTEWNTMAHAEFVESGTKKGKWKKLKADLPNSWNIPVEGLDIKLEFTQYKHIGIFPEQIANWKFIQENIQLDQNFLNLFAYTGVASLIARKVGAKVTHVDSVKQLLTWSKENMELSQLADVKWVLEDALKFAQREVKRGNKYEGIIMDPPAYGIGSKGEKWILEQQLPILFETANKLMAKNGFLIVNTYSPKISAQNLLQFAQKAFKGKTVKVEELWMNTTSEKEVFYGNTLLVK
ncbi:MAG: class I SAM-dependent methyltransferase [Bacteroidota bacterium]